jgi:hypothetical protein
MANIDDLDVSTEDIDFSTASKEIDKVSRKSPLDLATLVSTAKQLGIGKSSLFGTDSLDAAQTEQLNKELEVKAKDPLSKSDVFGVSTPPLSTEVQIKPTVSKPDATALLKSNFKKLVSGPKASKELPSQFKPPTAFKLGRQMLGTSEIQAKSDTVSSATQSGSDVKSIPAEIPPLIGTPSGTVMDKFEHSEDDTGAVFDDTSTVSSFTGDLDAKFVIPAKGMRLDKDDLNQKLSKVQIKKTDREALPKMEKVTEAAESANLSEVLSLKQEVAENEVFCTDRYKDVKNDFKTVSNLLGQLNNSHVELEGKVKRNTTSLSTLDIDLKGTKEHVTEIVALFNRSLDVDRNFDARLSDAQSSIKFLSGIVVQQSQMIDMMWSIFTSLGQNLPPSALTEPNINALILLSERGTFLDKMQAISNSEKGGASTAKSSEIGQIRRKQDEPGVKVMDIVSTKPTGQASISETTKKLKPTMNYEEFSSQLRSMGIKDSEIMKYKGYPPDSLYNIANRLWSRMNKNN